MPARFLNALTTLGLVVVVALFLSPLVLMFLHELDVLKAERDWQETVTKENAKTEKAIKAWRDAVERARVK
jgi:hypothetical protein